MNNRMIPLVIILCITQISGWGEGVPYITDKHEVEKEPLALVGLLGANSNLRTTVQTILNKIYSTQTNILPYLVDCSKPNAFCKAEDEGDLEIFSFGKDINYIGRNQEKDMLEWVEAVSSRQLFQLKTKQELVTAIEQSRFAYVFFPSENAQEQQMFITMSRKYLVTPMFLIRSQELREELEMKPGNITMYKNVELQKETFTHANSWERWESFLATYSFPGINYLDSNNFVNDRFRESTNIRFVGIFVDHSYSAQKHIETFYEFSRNNDYGMEMRLYLDYLRQSQMVKIYYHIRPKTFPALVFVRLVNQTLKVSVREGTFNKEELETFVMQAVNDELPPFYLSEPIPENNGYSGKGVEKTIQKIVYDNFHSLVINSQKTYVVIYTSVGQGCGNCESSYADFKKLKSYFEDEDIVFAKYQFVSNYIPEPLITTIPQVVIYKAGRKDAPITERYLSRFDAVLNLIREHIPLENEEL